MGKKEPKKAVSKSQRRLFGWAKACVEDKEKDCPKGIRKLGKNFKKEYPKDLDKMASTKEKGLPNKKENVNMNMNNYIKSFSNYKSKPTYINEEFIGRALKGVFNKVRNKFAMELSKNIGSAKKVKVLIDKYEQELDNLNNEYYNSLTELLDTYKAIKQAEEDGGEVSKLKEEMEEKKERMQKAEKILDKQKEVLKEKFDIQFKEIIREEKNPKIKQYINLEKIDMMQRMLANEMENIQKEVGFDKDDIEGSDFLQSILNKKTEEAKRYDEMQGKVEDALKKIDKKEESGETTISDEDIESLEVGDEIEYEIRTGGSKGDLNSAEVTDGGSDDIEDDELRVKVIDSENVITIKKDAIKTIKK